MFYNLSRGSTILENTSSTKLVIMVPMEDTKIAQLIKTDMKKRNQSIREYARTVGVSHPTIIAILEGDKPSLDTCKLLAPVLHIPVEEVLRMSELLPPERGVDPEVERIAHLANQLLDDEDKEELIRFLEMKLERQEREKVKNATRYHREPLRSFAVAEKKKP